MERQKRNNAKVSQLILSNQEEDGELSDNSRRNSSYVVAEIKHVTSTRGDIILASCANFISIIRPFTVHTFITPVLLFVPIPHLFKRE